MNGWLLTVYWFNDGYGGLIIVSDGWMMVVTMVNDSCKYCFFSGG